MSVKRKLKCWLVSLFLASIWSYLIIVALEAERHAHTDLQAAVSHLQTTLQKVREETATLEAELKAVKREVSGERAEKERQLSTLEEQKAQDQREVEVLEDILGLNIVGGDQPNTLLFRFRLVDPLEPEREFALVADVSEYEYKGEFLPLSRWT